MFIFKKMVPLGVEAPYASITTLRTFANVFGKCFAKYNFLFQPRVGDFITLVCVQVHYVFH